MGAAGGMQWLWKRETLSQVEMEQDEYPLFHAGGSRAVAWALMRNHLTDCAAQAIRTGSVEERETMYNELLGMIYKNAR